MSIEGAEPTTLIRLGELLLERWQDRFAQIGASPLELSVLRVIASPKKTDYCTVQRISEDLGLERGKVQRAVDHLQREKRWISSAEQPFGRKRILLSPTEAGIAALHSFDSRHNEDLRKDLLRHTSEAELAALISSAKMLTDKLVKDETDF